MDKISPCQKSLYSLQSKWYCFRLNICSLTYDNTNWYRAAYVTFFEVTLYVFKQQLHNQINENPYKFELNENTHLEE